MQYLTEKALGLGVKEARRSLLGHTSRFEDTFNEGHRQSEQ